jgi:hypothetical protein
VQYGIGIPDSLDVWRDFPKDDETVYTNNTMVSKKLSAFGGICNLGSVSKVDMATPMPLIYKMLFSSISTFETLPF